MINLYRVLIVSDVFVKAKIGESAIERDERAIMEAALWYRSHFSSLTKNVDLLILTSSKTFKSKCETGGLNVMLLEEYAEYVKDQAPDLIDMLSSPIDEAGTTGQKIEFNEYLPQNELLRGLKSGKFYQGKLSISHHNIFEGSVFANIRGSERSINIVGRKSLNRAVHDDIVVVELLSQNEWKNVNQTSMIDEEGDMVDSDHENVGMELDSASNEENFPINPEKIDENPAGKVVGIVRRNWRPYAGTIDTSKLNEDVASASVWFYPVDRRIPKIRIRTRQLRKLAGKRLLVSIDSWTINDHFPRGHYVKNLGILGDKQTEMESLLHEHDVPYQSFSPQIISELPVEGSDWTVKEEHVANRRDLRNLDICSIDPPGCTDIDDALHCRKLEDGVWECGVHIADVTYFVKPGTAMDEEAARRGTTVYLVNQRIDMLPPLLGTNLCSLRSDVERLAFSVIWKMDVNGNIIETDFCRSVIKSKASLTYAEAQAKIDDMNDKSKLTESIRQLNKFAKIFRQKRREAGSLTLSSPEVRFQLEHDSQDPVDVELKELKETNALVEEFMLLANISVAKATWKKFPEIAVLRRHPSPPETNFEGLTKALKEEGFQFNPDSSKELADSLDKIKKKDDPYFNTLARILTTRCMMQAVYFCSGSLPDNEFWHYGLATEIYTHFTSPIRRYSDVLVHRILGAVLDVSEIMSCPALFDRVKMSEICDNLNYRHRMAQQAGRSSVELFTHLYFKGKTVVEDGYITRILKNGFGVLVPKYGIEGFVHCSNNSESSDNFEFDVESNSLKNKNTTLKIFKKLKVEISIDESSVAGLRQRLKMKLVS